MGKLGPRYRMAMTAREGPRESLQSMPREPVPRVQTLAAESMGMDGGTQRWDALLERKVKYQEQKLDSLSDTVRRLKSDTTHNNTRPAAPRITVSDAPNVARTLDTHWVYALARKAPFAVPLTDSTGALATVERYKANPHSIDFKRVPSKKWYLLYYPMEEVNFADGSVQYFMRCKSVDRDTGQLAWSLVKVYERSTETEVRTFRTFSMYPGA